MIRQQKYLSILILKDFDRKGGSNLCMASQKSFRKLARVHTQFPNRVSSKFQAVYSSAKYNPLQAGEEKKNMNVPSSST